MFYLHLSSIVLLIPRHLIFIFFATVMEFVSIIFSNCLYKKMIGFCILIL